MREGRCHFPGKETGEAERFPYCFGAERAPRLRFFDRSTVTRGFESQLAGDDLAQRNIGERSARPYFHERPMPHPKLAHTFGDYIDENLLVGDDLGGFLQELSGHMA